MTTFGSNVEGLSEVLADFDRRVAAVEGNETHILGDGKTVLVHQDQNRFVVESLIEEPESASGLTCSGFLDFWSGSGFSGSGIGCSGICSGFETHFENCVPCSGVVNKLWDGTSSGICSGFCDLVNECVSGIASGLSCSGIVDTLWDGTSSGICSGFCDVVNECVSGVVTCSGIFDCPDICSGIQDCVPCDYINECVSGITSGLTCSGFYECPEFCEEVNECISGLSESFTITRLASVSDCGFSVESQDLTFENGLLTSSGDWAESDTVAFDECENLCSKVYECPDLCDTIQDCSWVDDCCSGLSDSGGGS